MWPRLFVNVIPYETLLHPIFFFLEEGFLRYVYGMVDCFVALTFQTFSYTVGTSSKENC